MEPTRPRFQKYIFVCENERETGVCCNPAGARLREKLKESVKSKGLASQIRVSRSGCLDVCAEGPNVLLAPDYVWFKRVRDEDVAAIVERAASGLAKKGE